MATRPMQQFSKGQTILEEGTPGDRAYRILSGEVIICKKNEIGDLIPLAKLGRGEMFGEMYLFDQEMSRTASAIALSRDVELEVYFQEELHGMLKRLNPSMTRIFEGLSLRLQKTSGKYVQTLTQRFLTKQPNSIPTESGDFIRHSLE